MHLSPWVISTASNDVCHKCCISCISYFYVIMLCFHLIRESMKRIFGIIMCLPKTFKPFEFSYTKCNLNSIQRHQTVCAFHTSCYEVFPVFPFFSFFLWSKLLWPFCYSINSRWMALKGDIFDSTITKSFFGLQNATLYLECHFDWCKLCFVIR